MLHAFPTPKECKSLGMSLRDYMATAIFCSLIQRDSFLDRNLEKVADRAYEYADFLLIARPDDKR